MVKCFPYRSSIVKKIDNFLISSCILLKISENFIFHSTSGVSHCHPCICIVIEHAVLTTCALYQNLNFNFKRPTSFISSIRALFKF